MELFSFLSNLSLLAIGQICLINIVLAGDNAIVIGMAARNVPENIRQKVILYGTFGAVIVRVAATLGIVYILEVPGLHLVGGLVLLYIAYKLLCNSEGECANSPVKDRFMDAVKTIVIADMVTGLDNVIAVAGAAEGSFVLVMIGLIISIPLVVFSSTLIVKVLDRFPALLFLGAFLIVYTGVNMIFHDAFVNDYVDVPSWVEWGLTIPFSYLVARIAGYDIMANLSPNSNQEEENF